MKETNLQAICLPCWRRGVSMTDDPPSVGTWPETVCVRCGRRTNHGIYIELEDLQRLPPDPEIQNRDVEGALKGIIDAMDAHDQRWAHRHPSKRPNVPDDLREAIQQAAERAVKGVTRG